MKLLKSLERHICACAVSKFNHCCIYTQSILPKSSEIGVKQFLDPATMFFRLVVHARNQRLSDRHHTIRTLALSQRGVKLMPILLSMKE
jgi:hypothetical protein